MLHSKRVQTSTIHFTVITPIVNYQNILEEKLSRDFTHGFYIN
jgi:hypothetical protein